MAERIWNASEKYAADGLLGIVINKVKKSLPESISQQINEANLKILGGLPYDETLEYNGIRKESQKVNKSVNDLLLRMNLPIME
jgi:CO dehydrogenase nickel-insertion accessory protein CooC1